MKTDGEMNSLDRMIAVLKHNEHNQIVAHLGSLHAFARLYS